MPDPNLFPSADLPVAKVRYRFSLPRLSPPDFWLGSTWRGILGNTLRELVCPFSSRTACEQCTIRKHCPAATLIKGHTAMPGLRDSPRGYVIDSMTGSGSRTLTMDLTLFGSTVQYAPIITGALEKGEHRGIFHDRTPYRIAATEQLTPAGETRPLDNRSAPDAAPLQKWLDNLPAPDAATYRFAAPVRLKTKGSYLSTMDWPFFFASLACLMHGGTPLGRETWTAMQQMFQEPGRIESHLTWKDLARYSSTQKRKVPLGGLVGTFDITRAADWIQPWLNAARVIHVGKGTAMGLGKITVDGSHFPVHAQGIKK